MWNDKLNEIKVEKETYNEEINGGATDGQIKIFKENAKMEIQVELPNEYLNIIKFINGIEFNGFILYGIDESLLDERPKQHINGLIELNQIWYENEEQKKYLFIGESNISWYVFDLQQKKYKELDNPSGSEMETFNHFEEMFEKLLSDALQ